MARVDRTITIGTPIEQVFEYVGDPTRWPEFHTLIDRAEQIDSRSYRLSGGSERRHFTYEIQVEGEPPRRFSWRYVGRLKGEGFYELTAVSGGRRCAWSKPCDSTCRPPSAGLLTCCSSGTPSNATRSCNSRS